MKAHKIPCQGCRFNFGEHEGHTKCGYALTYGGETPRISADDEFLNGFELVPIEIFTDETTCAAKSI